MTNLHSLADYRADGALVSPTAVAEALKALGGAAHRDAIVNLLLGSLSGERSRTVITEEVDRVLREHAGATDAFRQVFGPQSLRWSLNSCEERRPAAAPPRPAVTAFPVDRAAYAAPSRAAEPL
jgi:hypothetical protein